ncbi:esterase/lipase family protein [Kaarinaea lacus]
MPNIFIKIIALSLLCAACSLETKPAQKPRPLDQCVVLLHGLARTASSMEDMEAALKENGYYVVNVDYPSREHKIEDLATTVVPQSIAACNNHTVNKIHFVTHSLGGILVRYYLAHNTINNLGRVVMLSPPNQGSEVVDALKDMPGFHLINGPAGEQLGTDDASIPNNLPPVDYEVGVITGDTTVNYILSTLIPGDDDGKVSIERAKVQGMLDFLVVHHSHPFIMEADDVITQTLTFLREGQFDHTLKQPAPVDYWSD